MEWIINDSKYNRCALCAYLSSNFYFYKIVLLLIHQLKEMKC